MIPHKKYVIIGEGPVGSVYLFPYCYICMFLSPVLGVSVLVFTGPRVSVTGYISEL